MSDAGRPGGAAAAARRYLTSRKNIAGMAGALVGVGLHVVGDLWPVVAAGLYGVDGLAPPRKDLPPGALEAVREILDVLRVVLDRLDQVADQPVDRAAATDRLAASVPDVDVRRAEDLTEELRRRHGDPT